MPQQNRVNPFGEIIKTHAKGLFMGNRGILHDDSGNLTSKRWTHKSWIICSIASDPSGEIPVVKYTKLFFLDEATALAAGHRPCRQCRYKDFTRFFECWAKGNGMPNSISIKDIDNQLHKDRVNRENRPLIADPEVLPEGVFIELLSHPGTAWLIWNEELLKWKTQGYGERRKICVGESVKVLTPESIVKAIAAGYRPHIHHNK